MAGVPILGISGWSGSGKTTLIEQLLVRLRARGLEVAVVKHDAHGLDIDRAGKDTDRFFRAGAGRVCAVDEEQAFLRSRGTLDPEAAFRRIGPEADLILVEGFKQAAIPRIWLEHPTRDEPVPDGDHLLASLPLGPDRADRAEAIVIEWLEGEWRRRAIWVGLLIGGKSSRMGMPKSQLRLADGPLWRALFEQARRVVPNVALLGSEPVPGATAEAIPILPDVPDAQGPLAAILAAFRWNPSAAWIFLACDTPHMKAEFLEWLIGQRRPGVWAILPGQPRNDVVEPLAALYEPPMRTRFEELAAQNKYALQQVAQFPKVIVSLPPDSLLPCLHSANTPDQWRGLTGSDAQLGSLDPQP